MAGETQTASDGYGGEFHLHDGTSLYELKQVTSFDIPDEGDREQVECTHLKSAGRRREYMSTFFEDSDFEVVLNSRPLSDTDTKIAAARAAGTPREFKAVIPENGTPKSQVTGTCKVISYNRGTVSNDGIMEATMTCRVVTITDVAAYVAPGGGS